MAVRKAPGIEVISYFSNETKFHTSLLIHFVRATDSHKTSYWTFLDFLQIELHINNPEAEQTNVGHLWTVTEFPCDVLSLLHTHTKQLSKQQFPGSESLCLEMCRMSLSFYFIHRLRHDTAVFQSTEWLMLYCGVPQHTHTHDPSNKLLPLTLFLVHRFHFKLIFNSRNVSKYVLLTS